MIEQGSKTTEEETMKLWLLTPGTNQSAWDGWDVARGFVIRADTKIEARQIADGAGGEETRQGNHYLDEQHPWLDISQSDCTELLPDGEAGVVLEDYMAG